MKFNIANKTDNEVNALIEMYKTPEQAELMGFKFVLALIEGDTLEIKGFGKPFDLVQKPNKTVIGVNCASNLKSRYIEDKIFNRQEKVYPDLF